MPGGDQSMADVLKSAINHAQEMIRSEVALAKAEMREEMTRVGTGVAALAAAAVAGLMALTLLLTAIAWAIAEGLGWPVWTGFAVVTVAVGMVAAVLGYVGRARFAGTRHMPLTVDTLKENMQWLRTRTP